jgi:uncharacterized protein YdbL (DUF1318 family)
MPICSEPLYFRERTSAMKKFAMLFSLLLGLSLSGFALALTLDEAKSQGLVGEKADGYVAAVAASPTAEVQALVSTTNDGRRKVYEDLAKRNGITVDAVGVVSGEKLRANAGSGEYVQNAAGQWERKQ